jgi:DtxR family Mn-dependent transcriptional regulator
MHVIRRHRLVEAFLVEVLAMNWSEVHAEAEILEHAVSERLIERIDDMLGRPAFDPHGDPIPTARESSPPPARTRASSPARSARCESSPGLPISAPISCAWLRRTA